MTAVEQARRGTSHDHPDVAPGAHRASPQRTSLRRGLRPLLGPGLHGTDDRHHRLVREQLVVVAVLVALLVATLVLLGTQWLESGSTAAAAPPTSPASLGAQT